MAEGGGYRLALGPDRHRRGIVLGPLLMFLGWAETRESAGASSAFNLVNSPAGLAGRFAGFAALPAAVPLWPVAAVRRGPIGSWLGSRRLGGRTLGRLLAAVPVIAGLKMFA